MEKCHIEKCPAEVIIMIADYLDLVDHLNLRTMSKKLSSNLTPVVFKNVQCCYSPSSFENLASISKSPTLTQHVTSLWYSGLVFDEVDRELWEHSICSPEGFQVPMHPTMPDASVISEERLQDYIGEVERWAETCKPRNIYTEAELVAGFQAYSTKADATKSMEFSYIDFTSLAAATKNLAKLTSIHVQTNSDRGWFDYGGYWVEDKPSTQATLIKHSDLGVYRLEDTRAEKLAIRQVTSLFLALFAALPPNFKHFEVRQIPWSVIRNHFGKVLSLGTFANLTTLQIDVTDFEDLWMPTGVNHIERLALLAKVIQSIKGLEILYLDFHQHSQPPYKRDVPEHPIDWPQLIGDHVWPDLKEFKIGMIDMEPASLIDFCRRHPKLRSLLLYLPYLMGKDVSWYDTLVDLKNLNQLEKFQVGGVLFYELEEEVEGQKFEGVCVDVGLDQAIISLPDDGKTFREHVEDWFHRGGKWPVPKGHAAKELAES